MTLYHFEQKDGYKLLSYTDPQYGTPTEIILWEGRGDIVINDDDDLAIVNLDAFIKALKVLQLV